MVKHRSNEYTLEQGLVEADVETVTSVDNDDPVSARLTKLEAQVVRMLTHLDPAGTSVPLRGESEAT
jgi:hypothetical protein